METLYGAIGAAIFGMLTSTNALVVIIATPIITTFAGRIIDVRKILIGESLIILGLSGYRFVQGIMPLYFVPMGHSCPKWSVTEDATIPCIRYGELYTKFGAKIDKVYSYTNMPTEKLRFSKGTEVLIPRVGEDPLVYNHCTWLSLKDVAIGEMISDINTDQDPLISATMYNATLQKEFAIRVEGGSVTNLYFDKLRNIDISYPLLAEQKKIAAFFENLDHLITARMDDFMAVSTAPCNSASTSVFSSHPQSSVSFKKSAIFPS